MCVNAHVCVLLGRTTGRLRAESSFVLSTTDGRENSLTTIKKKNKKKSKMIIMCLVHIPDPFTAEHGLECYKEISFKIKLR